MFNEKKERNRYSLRKLSIGLASILLGISFVSVTGNSVKADTINSGSNSDQTAIKGSDTAIKIDPKTPEAVTKLQVADGKTTKDNNPEAAVKPTAQSTSKGANLIAKQQNTAVKATAEAAKQGLDTSVVPHNDSNENTLNVKDGNAIAQNMLKDDKENQAGADPAKSKLKMADLLTTTGKKLNAQMLSASKIMSPANDTNGGFDSSWGKLNVNDWQGSVQGDYYQLTDYTGDANHVIVPNEADFAKAGISTSGKQVGVTSSLMHNIFTEKATAKDATVAFSKTNNKMVKAINADWHDTWKHNYVVKAKLSRFDGTNLDVSNMTNMSHMFSGNQISDLSPLANWHVNNVTNMDSMFYFNKISDLRPLANWYVNNVIDMISMFQRNDISDLSPLANWHVNNVTDMSYMFSGNQISDLSPLAGWNTGKVTDMEYMFDGNQISDLSPLANWHVNNVTDMMSMFSDNQISDLSPLANWNTGKVTDMRNMFDNNQISDLSPLAGWNTSDVTDMGSMFDYNSSTQTKTIQAKRMINFVYPAGYIGKKQDLVTQTVDMPTKQVKVELTTKYFKPSNNILDWVTKTETPISTPIDPVYFEDYTVPEIKGLLEPDKTVISRQQADVAKPINVTVTYKLVDSNTNDAYALDSKNELHEHINVNDNGGYDADFWGKINVADWNYTVNGDRIEINGLKDGISTGANDAVIVPNLDDFKLVGKDGGAKAVYISNNALVETAKHKYYGLSKTNGNTFTTDNNLFFAFYNDNLTHADLNSLNTGNTTNMNYTFYNASSLKNLDVSNWDTNKVTNMNYMFNGASGLTSLDVSKWKTGNVTDMNNMFSGANNLTSLDVSNWDTGNVTNMSWMFHDASELKNLDVSKWETSNVTDMHNMFDRASSLTSLDVSKWDTSNVTNMSMMFNGASRLTSLDVSNWDTGNVTNMSWMFNGASSLTSLDVSNWETSNVTNMTGMFNSAKGLKNLDVSKWNTGKVTDMSWMFYNASGLKNLDVSKWNTSKVTDMSYMFYNASGLTSLDVSKWDTSKVTNMGWMFNDDSSLALIVNGDKFADYLAKNNFADSRINSSIKSVTTNNVKLLKLLTSDAQHDSSTRTIVFTFPANYSPDLAKYHLTKNGNTYQIKQSIDYAKSYLQGTVLINGADDITKHHIDTTKTNKLSDTWQPNYDKLILAHKNADGTVSFDKVQLPKIPGYKTEIKHNSSKVTKVVNRKAMPFIVSYIAIPTEPAIVPDKPATKPDKPIVKLNKPDVMTSRSDVQDYTSDRDVQTPIAVADDVDTSQNVNPVDFGWKITAKMGFDNIKHQATTYKVTSRNYSLTLPYVENRKLHLVKQYTTKDAVSFAYMGQNTKYVFNIKFVNGHYLLTTYKIKSGKLVKLIDYSFIKSSKMIDIILDWLQIK